MEYLARAVWDTSMAEGGHGVNQGCCLLRCQAPINASSPLPFQETQLQHVDNQWLILFRLGRKLLGHQIKSD